MSGANLKLCRDCRWMRRGFATGYTGEKCADHVVSPALVNVVTGSTKPEWQYCSTARIAYQNCGPEGTRWQQR